MTVDPDEKFAAQLKVKREALGLSQADLAARISVESGLSFQGSTIYKIEKGNRKVTVAEAVAIASALRSPLTEMVNAGGDAARVAKDVLMDYGVSGLIEVEAAHSVLSRVSGQQARMRAVLANYRDLFGVDPMWLQIPSRPSLRDFWGPFVDWDGPSLFTNSWHEFMRQHGEGYGSFLDYDREVWAPDPERTEG